MRRSVCILAALVAVLAASVSSASATNWKLSPAGGGQTNTAGTTFLKAGVAGSPQLSCTSASALATASGTGGGVLTGPLSTAAFPNAAAVTPKFATCSAAGTTYTVACNKDITSTGTSAALNANANGLTGGTLGASNTGVVSGTLTGITCVVKVSGVACRTITGTVNGSYNNATGTLTVAAAGQSLSVSTAGTCAVGSGGGSATFASNAAGTTDVVYTTTAPLASRITAYWQ